MRSKITNVPANLKNPQLRVLLTQIRDAILNGALGTGKAVTFDHMRRAGMVDAGGNVVPGTPEKYDPMDDYSIPDAPTALMVSGAFTYIIVSWEGYDQRNVSYTEVWRNSIDDLDTAVVVGTSNGLAYSDPVGVGQSYYYWVRFISYTGTPSPFNSLSGSLGTTADDPAKIATLLNGQITEAQLHTDLQTRVGKIELLEGSVQTLTSNVNGHSIAIQQVSGVTNSLAAQWMLKTDVNGRVAGFGLYNTGATSGFIINADNFAVGRSGYNNEYPFMVGTVNGVTRIALNAATFIPDAAITSAKIRNAAIDTAHIANGVIVSAKIQDGAIVNAKIQNGAITTAKIGTAAVDTLQIAGNAVTVPVGSNGFGGSAPTGFSQVCNVPAFYSQAPGGVIVQGSVQISNNTGGDTSVHIRIRDSLGNVGGQVGATCFSGTSVCLSTGVRFNGAAGSITYYLEVRSDSGLATCGNSHISVMGAKR